MFVTQGTRNEIRDLEESSRDGERHGNGVSHTHTRAHTQCRKQKERILGYASTLLFTPKARDAWFKED